MGGKFEYFSTLLSAFLEKMLRNASIFLQEFDGLCRTVTNVEKNITCYRWRGCFFNEGFGHWGDWSAGA